MVLEALHPREAFTSTYQAPIKQSLVTLGSVPDLQAFSSPCSDVVRRPQPTVTSKLIALTFKGLLMG
jgi:hypothetical protein